MRGAILTLLSHCVWRYLPTALCIYTHTSTWCTSWPRIKHTHTYTEKQLWWPPGRINDDRHNGRRRCSVVRLSPHHSLVCHSTPKSTACIYFTSIQTLTITWLDFIHLSGCLHDVIWVSNLKMLGFRLDCLIRERYPPDHIFGSGMKSISQIDW